jgi:hypothetical protein
MIIEPSDSTLFRTFFVILGVLFFLCVFDKLMLSKHNIEEERKHNQNQQNLILKRDLKRNLKEI